MSDEIRAALLGEAAAITDRLAQWLETPTFGRPQRESVPDPTFKMWPLSYVETIATHFVTRLDWNLRAIVVLCREGMAVQAQPILRASLESAIDLRYISTNPQTLVTKWCSHEEIQRYRYWRDRPEAERPSDYGLGEREVANRLALLDRHAPHANGKPWRLKELVRDWDFTNLAVRDQTACEILAGKDQALHGIYKLLCGNLHGGTEAAGDFVVANGEGKFEMVRSLPKRKLVFVPFFAMYSMEVSLRAAERCGAVFDRNLGPQWDALGVDSESLAAAASADFEYVPAD